MLTNFILSSLLTVNVSTSSNLNTRNSIKVRVNSEEAVMIRQELRSNIEERKTEREESAIEFQTKIQTIRDEHKQQVALRIYNNFNNINNRFIEKYNSALERLSGILAKLEESADPDLYSEAQSAIAEAQAAVDEQALNDYQFEITQNNLGVSIRTTLNQLHTDLKAVFDLVKSAKDAVRLAYQSTL